MSRQIVRLYVSTVVRLAVAAIVVAKSVTWLATAQIPILSQLFVAEVLPAVAMAVGSEEEWSATTELQPATSAVGQTIMRVTARPRP